jgi:two-component system response regulator GlrR
MKNQVLQDPAAWDEESPVSSRTQNDQVTGLIGRSPPFLDALRRIRRIAATDATTLIGGESGTGKELAARAIHYLGPRRDRPFVCVNCGALPDGLIESELFGHERGAFTGAGGPATGLVASAEDGTLFLDEVEEMSGHTQVALLRFLQDHVYRPVGSRRFVRAHVRVIAASNCNLLELAQAGQFRQDLLFRLRLMLVDMPPLRQRADDVGVLAQYFLDRFARQYGGPAKRIGPPLLDLLSRYHWPGNVRELENVLHRGYLFSDGEELHIESADLTAGTDRDIVAAPRAGLPVTASLPDSVSFSEAKALVLARFEHDFVCRALRASRGNISAAARTAGKERRAFGRLVKKHGIDKERLNAMPARSPLGAAAAGASASAGART